MGLFWIVRDVVFWISDLPTRCISDCAIRREIQSNESLSKIVSAVQKTPKQSLMFFPRFFLAGEGE